MMIRRRFQKFIIRRYLGQALPKIAVVALALPLTLSQMAQGGNIVIDNPADGKPGAHPAPATAPASTPPAAVAPPATPASPPAAAAPPAAVPVASAPVTPVLSDAELKKIGIDPNTITKEGSQLSATELTHLGISIQSDKDLTQRSDDTVSLNGMLFTSCLNLAKNFSISNYSTEKATGFVVNDPGHVLSDCQTAVRNSQKSNGVPALTCAMLPAGSCTPINSLANASINLTAVKGIKDIGVFHQDLGSDTQTLVFETLGDTDRVHKGAEVFKAEQAAAAARKKQAHIDALKSTIIHCNKTEDQLEIAQDACQLYERLMNLSDDDVQQSLPQCSPKKITQEKLKLLMAAAQKLNPKDTDKLQDLEDQISDFASDYPDQADAAANVYLTIANKIVSNPAATADDYAAAKTLVTSAGDLDGLSDAQTANIQNFQNNVDYGTLVLQGKSNQFSLFNFMPAYQSLAQQSYQNVISSCGMGSASAIGTTTGATSTCGSNMSFYQKVSQLPQVISQEQRQIQQQQLSFQTQMNQAMSTLYGGINNGMYPMQNQIR